MDIRSAYASGFLIENWIEHSNTFELQENKAILPTIEI